MDLQILVSWLEIVSKIYYYLKKSWMCLQVVVKSIWKVTLIFKFNSLLNRKSRKDILYIKNFWNVFWKNNSNVLCSWSKALSRNFALYIHQQIWISFPSHLKTFVIFNEIVKPFPSDEYQEPVAVLRDNNLDVASWQVKTRSIPFRHQTLISWPEPTKAHGDVWSAFSNFKLY